MKHLRMQSKAEVVKWYETTFHITPSADPSRRPEPAKLPAPLPKPEKRMNETVSLKWASLPPMNAEQRAYLKSRSIDPDKVSKYAKDNGGRVSCGIYDESGIITLQSRDINEKRFMIEKGTSSKGCFVSDINKDVKRAYVVE